MFDKESNNRHFASGDFEWLFKQYYDAFAYHASQRLTAFNFFIVSLSFFSNAFATFLTRGNGESGNSLLAAGLAITAWLLTICFARLDKRNEEIIQINEQPIKILQRHIAHDLMKSDDFAKAFDSQGNSNISAVFQTFKETDSSIGFRTFGCILPVIFTLSAAICLLGAGYAFSQAEIIDIREGFFLVITLFSISYWFIHYEVFPKKCVKN